MKGIRYLIITKHFFFKVRMLFHFFNQKLKNLILIRKSQVRSYLAKKFKRYEWLDFDLHFGPVLEQLQPSLIHAHDIHMLGVAVNAARNLRKNGFDTKVIYDAHELIEGLTHVEKSIIQRWLRHEKEYIHEVDEVTCVSEPQSKRIQARYNLDTPPKVILNCPILDTREKEIETIRDQVNIQGKILVYHGKVSDERGIDTLVKSLEFLDQEIHIVILCEEHSHWTDHLISISREISKRVPTAEKRLHFLPYVPAEDLPIYLSTADIAVIPLLPTENHEVAMPNKLFESMQARLPILSSDREALASYIKENRIGAIYKDNDPIELAKQAHLLLLKSNEIKASYNDELIFKSSWESQSKKLISIYNDLVPAPNVNIKRVRLTDTQLQEQQR